MTIIDVTQVSSVLSPLQAVSGIVVAKDAQGTLEIYSQKTGLLEISVTVAIVESIDKA